MADKRFTPPMTRRSGLRDAKLIIIAAEGQRTEKDYFEGVAQHYFNPRAHVEVLERGTSAADPQHVLQELERFCRRYKINKGYDELWLVVDIDRWAEKMLSEVAALCNQKKYKLAVSNPCFELWLLLHLKSLHEYTADILSEFKKNRRRETGDHRTRLEIELVRLLAGYSKNKLDLEPFLNHVQVAIARAEALDLDQQSRWPADLGSRVYLIAKQIIAKQSPTPTNAGPF